MSAPVELEKPRVLTPNTIVMHDHSLLASSGLLRFLLRSATWDIEDMERAARELGVNIFYEPMRSVVSPARMYINTAKENDLDLQVITHLAESARSERTQQDYLKDPKRLPFKFIYALLKQVRFDERAINELVDLQKKVPEYNNQPVPVRVYAGREGVSTAAILDERLKMKIYAPDLPSLLRQRTKKGVNQNPELRAQYVVERIQRDVGRYSVAGIELNLLDLLRMYGSDLNFLQLLIPALMEARHPTNTSDALVQTVIIQPSRVDKGQAAGFGQFEEILKAMSNFQGTVIYAPGKGDPRTEIEELKQRMNRN